MGCIGRAAWVTPQPSPWGPHCAGPTSCSRVGAEQAQRRGPSQVTTRLYWRRGHTTPSALGPDWRPPHTRLHLSAALPALRLPPTHPATLWPGPAQGPHCPPPKSHQVRAQPQVCGSCQLPGPLAIGNSPLPAADEETEARAPGPLGPGPSVLCSGVSVSTDVSSCQHVAPQTPQDSLQASFASPWHSGSNQQFLRTLLARPPNPGPGSLAQPGSQRPVH